jgi:hypothetical protein
LGDLLAYVKWDDQLALARLDVTSNEIFVPGMATSWLPDLYYFAEGAYENPIHYEKTNLAEEVELGGIADPLELLQWWIDEAGESIDRGALLLSLDDEES